MPQFPLCSEFIPLLDSVKNQLAELKNLSQEFLRFGDDGAKQKALLKSQELERTKQQMVDLKEQPVDFEGKHIPRIEKELLVFFKNKLGEDLKYEIDNNRVDMIDVAESSKPAEILESVLKFIRLFYKLQRLHCFDTQITTLLELPRGLRMFDCDDTQIITLPELPDSLRWLNCVNTPAAKNPETKKQLEEFKKSHPQFEYRIVSSI